MGGCWRFGENERGDSGGNKRGSIWIRVQVSVSVLSRLIFC